MKKFLILLLSLCALTCTMVATITKTAMLTIRVVRTQGLAACTALTASVQTDNV